MTHYCLTHGKPVIDSAGCDDCKNLVGGFSSKGTLSPIRPVYKPVKEYQPHCPKCNERLRGNNSIVMPYECACGVWKPVRTFLEDFEIESR